jgi:hypothetical protein
MRRSAQPPPSPAPPTVGHGSQAVCVGGGDLGEDPRQLVGIRESLRIDLNAEHFSRCVEWS